MAGRVKSGHMFGCYVVVGPDEDRKGRRYWLCKCSCGNVKSVREDHVLDGKVISCGCHKDKNTADRMRIHGKSQTPIYRIYKHIYGRCYCKTDKRYKDYGGRGITVCEEWKNDFLSFYEWAIKNGYEKHLTIDRIDNDGNYSPDNCRWVSLYVQANNKRNNHFIEYAGIRLTVSQWAHRVGMNPKILDNRLRRGWSEERSITQPLRKHTKQGNI